MFIGRLGGFVEREGGWDVPGWVGGVIVVVVVGSGGAGVGGRGPRDPVDGARLRFGVGLFLRIPLISGVVFSAIHCLHRLIASQPR